MTGLEILGSLTSSTIKPNLNIKRDATAYDHTFPNWQ
jgi:hypothetical protein